jgi:hypothetical protein
MIGGGLSMLLKTLTCKFSQRFVLLSKLVHAVDRREPRYSFPAQENHQWITTTVVGKIEAQNSKLVAELSELLDFQTRRLLEETFKDTENQVRTLVADLVEGMWAQRRRVIGIKQRIQQYGPKEEGFVDHGSSSNGGPERTQGGESGR